MCCRGSHKCVAHCFYFNPEHLQKSVTPPFEAWSASCRTALNCSPVLCSLKKGLFVWLWNTHYLSFCWNLLTSGGSSLTFCTVSIHWTWTTWIAVKLEKWRCSQAFHWQCITCDVLNTSLLIRQRQIRKRCMNKIHIYSVHGKRCKWQPGSTN